MIRFLIKGLLRDRHRSLFPVIVITGGVMFTTLYYGIVLGMRDDTFKMYAVFDTGHVKVTTRAYSALAGQLPNDLAFYEIDGLIKRLESDYPEMCWTARIKFGGLLDLPDENGETRAQGPIMGLAIDLFNAQSGEIKRFDLKRSLVRGHLPRKPGEILISETLAGNLKADVGDMATLIGGTAKGGMAIQNFILAGTVRFNVGPMDRNLMIADLADIQYALDMEGGAGEILGFTPGLVYNQKLNARISRAFNARFQELGDEYAPVMVTLRGQNGLGEMIDFATVEFFIVIASFIFVMSIVLWNAGLMSGLRRYGEMGMRLAMGEKKGHVYCSLIYESISIGTVSSILGIAFGMGICYWLQEAGLDMGSLMKGSAVVMSDIIRAKVTPSGFLVGFIPGLLSTVFGSLVSGIGIFKRQTSQLFKELET